jgi:hypothetical protein
LVSWQKTYVKALCAIDERLQSQLRKAAKPIENVDLTCQIGLTPLPAHHPGAWELFFLPKN